jgi:lysophospholipase L1-like esterase
MSIDTYKKGCPPSHLAVGDSITHHGLYLLYLDVFHLTRFPQRPLRIINRGLSGDTLEGALKRFPWDILPLRVETASVMFGMNDLDLSLYGTGQSGPEVMRQRTVALERFEENLRRLVAGLQTVAGEVFLLTPTIFDGTGIQDAPNYPDYNAALARGARRMKHIGESLGIPVIDFHGPLTDINRRGQALRPDSTVVGPDRIHPQAVGHLIMTHLFLKAREQPGDIARVTLRAVDAAVLESVTCRVSDCSVLPDGIAFTYQADALPFPVDDAAREALNWVPFTEDFNREILRVTGLGANAPYLLEIDGKAICACTGEEWNAGVNLASLSSTPQNIQSHRILKMSQQRWELIWKLRDFVMVECQAAPEGRLRRPSAEEINPLLAARLGLSGK